MVNLFSYCFKYFSRAKRVYLTHDNSSIRDGIGAQLQRFYAVESTCRLLNLPFFPEPIEDIAVTPLDSFHSVLLKKDIIERINKTFLGKGNLKIRFDNIVLLKKFYPLFILLISMYYSVLQKKVLIKIRKPYNLIDKNPSIFLLSDSLIDSRNQVSKSKLNHSKKRIVIHLRKALLGNTNKNIRVTDEYKIYTALIRDFPEVLSNREMYNIVILTDAPEFPKFFNPPSDQVDHWVSLGYDISESGIRVPSYSFENSPLSKLQVDEVRRGNDPIEDIFTMACADILFGSKSSFSYTAALLNSSGLIYFDQDFWHPKLNGWRSY